MENPGTPGPTQNDSTSSATDSNSRIQAGMGTGSTNAYSEPLRPTQAGIVTFPGNVAEPPIPVWMQRTSIVLRFLICVWLGMILSVLPWTPLWTDNSLMLSLPKIREFASLGFIKGMVTGLGLVDIWMGIWEAVHYRDIRPLPPNSTR